METEVEFRPPRGINRMPDDRPITMGAVGAEADQCDLGQTHQVNAYLHSCLLLDCAVSPTDCV